MYIHLLLLTQYLDILITKQSIKKMQLSWQKHAPPTLLTLGMQQKYASYMLLDIATFLHKILL